MLTKGLTTTELFGNLLLKQNSMKPGDYISIRDPKSPPAAGDGHMPTVRGFSVGVVYKVNDELYVTVILPNDIKQKIPRGRCKVLKDEKEYFMYLLKGNTYQY